MQAKLQVKNPSQTNQLLLQKIRLCDAGKVIDHISDAVLLPQQETSLEMDEGEGYLFCNRSIAAGEPLPVAAQEVVAIDAASQDELPPLEPATEEQRGGLWQRAKKFFLPSGPTQD